VVGKNAKSIFMEGVITKYVLEYPHVLTLGIVLNIRQFVEPNQYLLFCVEDGTAVVAINTEGVVLARWDGESEIARMDAR
jgi:hypothetical protein